MLEKNNCLCLIRLRIWRWSQHLKLIVVLLAVSLLSPYWKRPQPLRHIIPLNKQKNPTFKEPITIKTAACCFDANYIFFKYSNLMRYTLQHYITIKLLWDRQTYDVVEGSRSHEIHQPGYLEDIHWRFGIQLASQRRKSTEQSCCKPTHTKKQKTK